MSLSRRTLLAGSAATVGVAAGLASASPASAARPDTGVSAYAFPCPPSAC